MDIRLTAKDYKIVKRLFEKCTLPNKHEIVLTRDDTIEESLIMVKTESGTLEPWTFGRKNIASFLRHGVVMIQKRCPFSFLRLGKCTLHRCQFFQIRNRTGDCAVVWNLFVK